MTCPRCGEDLPDENLKFCDQCGAPIPAKRRAPIATTPVVETTPAAPGVLVILKASLGPTVTTPAKPAAKRRTRAPRRALSQEHDEGAAAPAVAEPAAGSERFVPFASRRALRVTTSTKGSRPDRASYTR